MAVFGQGIVPASGNITAELSAITRRAFVPELFVQFYSAAPGLTMLLRNAQRAQGGLSQVTIPVQGNQMTTASWAGYSGGFAAPSIQPGISTAQFNMSLLLTPIPITGPESLMQTTEAVIPLLRARLADARNQMIKTTATAMYGTGSTDPTGLTMLGLIDAYDSGTTVGTYGGINRTTNSFWAGNLVSSSITPTRVTIAKQIMSITTKAGGEAPDLVIMSMSDWTTLMTDFMNSETFFTTPTSRYGKDDAVNAGFSAIMLNNTPIIGDNYLPKGTMFMVNTRYLAGYIAESANFNFSGFYSMIPNNQVASQGVLALGIQAICAKPVSGGLFTTIAGGAF